MTAARRATHTTAVVLVPPAALWTPIQAIRREHDRQFRRWMPHVTLLYPFAPREEFDALAPRLERALATQPPFAVTLRELGLFRHGRGQFTLVLLPEPRESLRALQDRLQAAAPEFDDVRRFASGFTAHLSLGQAHGAPQAEALQRALAARWTPVCFAVEGVQLIARSRPPDDVFSIVRELRLGAGPERSAPAQ